MKLLLLTAGLLLSSAFSATVTCPSLTCTSLIDSDATICYKQVFSNTTGVVSNLYAAQCGSDEVCHVMDLTTLGWVDNNLQQYTTGTSFPLSQQYLKRQYGRCKKRADISSNLLAGRFCSYDHECASKVCMNGVCRGLQGGEACSKHEECDVELGCRRTLAWPFKMVCKSLANLEDFCDDDSDCNKGLFCWYKTDAESDTNTKRCMKAFTFASSSTEFGWKANQASDLDNTIQNGRVCQTGFAKNNGGSKAICVSLEKIEDSSTGTITAPYECNATDTTVMCKYHFGAGIFV